MPTKRRTWKPINGVNQECGQNKSKAGFDMLVFKNNNEFVVHRSACAKAAIRRVCVVCPPTNHGGTCVAALL